MIDIPPHLRTVRWGRLPRARWKIAGRSLQFSPLGTLLHHARRTKLAGASELAR